MSIEQAVRERHAFEDRLKNFLILASILTDRELEISLSRLADMAKNMGEAPEILLRGQVLMSYCELRRRGTRRHRAFKRVVFTNVPGMLPFDGRIDSGPSDHYIRATANFPLLIRNQMAPPPSTEDGDINQTVLLLAP